MVLVQITMNVLPEKQLEFVQTILSMIEPTRRETGCLGYRVFCNIENQSIYSLQEEWETREDLDHHIGSPRFAVLLGTKILLRDPPTIEIHTVNRSEGMEAVDAVRKTAK